MEAFFSGAITEELRNFSASIPELQLSPDHPSADIELCTSSIEGCLFPGEEAFLAQLARSCTGKGVIVEIGSYLGRSAVSLGLGSLQGSRTMVFTYDHFLGDPYMTVLPEQYEILKRNILRAEADSIVLTSNVTSNQAAGDFKDPIELLFIDADHTYEEVKHDHDLWSSKVVSGGIIAFHDTFDPIMHGLRFDGPIRVVQELSQSPEWKIVGRFQSITVLKKNGVPLKKKPVELPVESVKIELTPKPVTVFKGGKKK